MRQIKLVKQSTCHRNILQADYDRSVLYRMDAVIFVGFGGFRPDDFSLEKYKAADDTNPTQFSNLPDGFEAENVSDSSSSE